MKNQSRMRSLIILWCVFTVLTEEVKTTAYTRRPSGVLQVIRRLGDNRSGAVKVSQGPNKKGESPIYFIKLPPTPYFYMKNIMHGHGISHQNVPVDFTNNGRPGQVYHWSLPDITHQQQVIQPISPPVGWPLTEPSVTSPFIPPSSSALTMSSEVPQAVSSESRPDKSPGNPSKKTWLSHKKQYAYNGRASGVYIFKSKRPLSILKDRRPLGKLLRF